MKAFGKKTHSLQNYIDGILSSDRFILSKAITLIESSLEKDTKIAEKVIEGILPYAGNSMRVGITGAPGVGKSTFVEALGEVITTNNLKVAVLTVDPSSSQSKGSILGDKIRMEKLSGNPLAFIRSSPAGNILGGVGKKTRESILLCEAAGFQVILIETVGVGQSETVVRSMVDFFLLLLLPGAGDELQGIKKGILEMADLLVVNKADRENLNSAHSTQHDFQQALTLFQKTESDWLPAVLQCSALEKIGIDQIWRTITDYKKFTEANGFFNRRRQNQNLNWMHELIRYDLEKQFYENNVIQKALPTIEKQIREGKQTATTAAAHLLRLVQDAMKTDQKK